MRRGINVYPRRKDLKIRRFLCTENTCPRCGGWKEKLEEVCADCEFDEQLEAVEGHEKVEKEEEEAGISFPASEKLQFILKT